MLYRIDALRAPSSCASPVNQHSGVRSTVTLPGNLKSYRPGSRCTTMYIRCNLPRGGGNPKGITVLGWLHLAACMHKGDLRRC